MILFFYNLALLAALAAGAPWWLWRMAKANKYREGLAERLGRVPKHLCDAPGQRPVIWLHAVSVGEVLAASRLVQELGAAFPGHRLLISTTTRTGHTLARERFGADRVFYCPLDFPWAVRAYLKALRPVLLILAETEFWPNLLNGCFRREIPVAVVNARISDRSWPRYQMLRRLWRPILGQISRVLAQSEIDAERLKALGCLPEYVTVAGNLKFDVRAAQQAEATRLLQSLAPGLRVSGRGKHSRRRRSDPARCMAATARNRSEAPAGPCSASPRAIRRRGISSRKNWCPLDQALRMEVDSARCHPADSRPGR